MIERALLRSLTQPSEHYDGLVGIAVPVLQRIADGNRRVSRSHATSSTNSSALPVR